MSSYDIFFQQLRRNLNILPLLKTLVFQIEIQGLIILQVASEKGQTYKKLRNFVISVAAVEAAGPVKVTINKDNYCVGFASFW